MKNNISRRKFICNTALGVATVALTPFNSLIANTAQSKWPSNASKYRIKMIGHGHLDPVWLWRWPEGVSVVHSTFRSTLDRMKEMPNMVFTSSSAQFYQWVADTDPEMMKEIRGRVKEGRWNVVGGWWVEPDVNIPSGEAMVRQGLYGQLTMEHLLGIKAKVAFNPDSFGHAATLPQIIKKQGMENYAFLRPRSYEKALPADLFWWESPDGTKVLTYRIQYSYNESKSVRQRLEFILNMADKEPMNRFMAFYGVGDHGGGPTKENLRSIEEIKKEEGAPKIQYGSMDEYFDEIRADKSLNLPTLKDELQHHAVGSYTACSGIKKGNRHAEAALVTAEKITSLGSFLWDADYPKEQFTSAWKKVLFLQFHDSLAGVSLVSHTKDAMDGYGYALNIAQDATYLALQKLEWQVGTDDPESEYMVVFNPHAWEVKTTVGYDFGRFNMEEDFSFIPDLTDVTDSSGKALPHQWILGESQTGVRKRLVVHATIPAMGYQQIRIKPGKSFEINNPVKAEINILENEFYKIRFSNNGTVNIFDKETRKEVFSGQNVGCRAVVIDDPSDSWSHDVVTYDKEIGTFGNSTVKVLDNGPFKATLRVISYYEKSKLSIDWTLFSGSRNIEADVTLDWHEKLKILKFSFPINVEFPVATYEVPYGSIAREVDGRENPGQRWIDVTGEQNDSTYGLTVINDAKYGYDVNGNDMRISIVRSPVFAHHVPNRLEPDQEYVWMDQGIQQFRMLLVPHKETWKETDIARTAEEFLSRPICIYQGIHQGTMPKSNSFLSIDKPNVIISSVKKTQVGDDLIIRCVETHGKTTNAAIYLSSEDQKWNLKFGKSEIKTLLYDRKSRKMKEVNLLEE